jgi:hypothetical protein
MPRHRHIIANFHRLTALSWVRSTDKALGIGGVHDEDWVGSITVLYCTFVHDEDWVGSIIPEHIYLCALVRGAQRAS